METKAPMERRQCTAPSRQSGERCKRRPIPGGTVCVIHGGGNPNTRARAMERIAAAVDPAIAYLLKAARQKKINAAGITAARDLLDRAGFKPAERQEISGPGGGAIQTDNTLTIRLVKAEVETEP